MTRRTATSDMFLRRRILSLVREYAEDTSKVAITRHAEDRMYERGISFDTVLKLLRQHTLTYERQDEKGNDIVKATGLVNPPRSASAVCSVVVAKERIVVITTMWEDMK